MAFAKYQQGQLTIAPYCSGIKLIGGSTDRSTIQYAAGLTLRYAFSPFLSGEINGGMGWVRPRTSDSHFQVDPLYPYRTLLYPWSATLRLHLLPRRGFVPFIGLGAGLTYWDLRDISQGDKLSPFPPPGETVYGLKNNLTMQASLGFTLFLSRHLNMEISTRYSHLLDQKIDNIGLDDANNGIAEIRLNLGYSLGVSDDKDKDITHYYMDPRYQTEESEPVKERFPELEKTEPPDTTVIPPETEKETAVTETVKEEVPPPREPSPARPVFEPGRSLVLPGISFQSGSTVLTENARRILNLVVESMQDYPDMRLEIRGFTDSVGSATLNLNLSQRRAEAVRDYLVSQGIAFDRLVAVGYGEAEPVASNATPEGRARNRRIEFIRIEE